MLGKLTVEQLRPPQAHFVAAERRQSAQAVQSDGFGQSCKGVWVCPEGGREGEGEREEGGEGMNDYNENFSYCYI